MPDRMLKLYHRLPPQLRSLAATVRGLQLRRWRYGPDAERLVEAAFERESWNADRWRDWQQERLARILHRAATRVPYYRSMWQHRRRRGDRASWEHLENWPILEKEEVRARPAAFLADDCRASKLFQERTSGTTGTPLKLWFGRDTVRAWYALFEARTRRWYGVSRHDPWANLGGQMIVARHEPRSSYWVWNAALKQLYMSSFHLSPDRLPHYVDAIRRYRLNYLFGYSSSLFALAQAVLHADRDDLGLKVAVTNAEPLYAYQREMIQAAFRCPVRETYGMCEIVTNASECEHGTLHLWPESGWTEVVEGDRPLGAGETGDLVCTGLLNEDMPLIRYRVGDRGQLAANDAACACGRSLPILEFVEGRRDDVLLTSDGRRIGRVVAFKADLPIREAQIIQEAIDRLRVLYVPTPQFTPQDGESMVAHLQEKLGTDVRVVLEPTDAIPRTANGKFRAVVSKLSTAAAGPAKPQHSTRSTLHAPVK